MAIDGEAGAGGLAGCAWAIARQAREMVQKDEAAGRTMLALAGGSPEAISAETVAKAAVAGNTLAHAILENVGRALVAGCVSLVNVFNPCRLILGGGVIDGLPELIDTVRSGVRQRALPAATIGLDVVPGLLGNKAGAIGAASLAMSAA